MSRRRLLVAGAIAATVVIVIIVAWPWVRAYTGMAPPEQFFRPLSPPAEAPTQQVLGVAHNAGNDAATTAAALQHGADVIEIDVIKARGKLAAGRVNGWAWLAERVFQGDTLDDAWRHAAAAKIIQLDLQQSGRDLLDSLAEFLHDRPGRQVLVSTRDASAIEYLRRQLPATVTLVFTVAFPDDVAEIRADRGLADAVGGISVFDGLVDTSLVRWAHERDLLVLAWTVNDGTRLNQLLRLGVDGVTTDNLAVLQALSR